MRWGAVQSIKVTLAIVILACIVTVLFSDILVENAYARADFVKWSNRSARVLEPGDYNTNGTCSNKICSWNGTQGIGNLGIGNSSVAAFTNNTTKDETLYPDYDLQGVVTTRNSQYPDVNCISGERINKALDFGSGNVSENSTESNQTIPGNSTEEASNTSAENATSTTSATENAASGSVGKTPGIFSYGEPYPGILDEYPVEAAAVYGKMNGLRMPDGRLIDIGVKSIGYEY